MESLIPYFDESFKARLQELEQYMVPARGDQNTTPREDPSRHHYAVSLKPYRRVLGWNNISPERMKKLMWDNAVRFFGEP